MDAAPDAADAADAADAPAIPATAAPAGTRIGLPDGLVDGFLLWLLLRVGVTLIALFVVIEGRAAGPCPTDAHLSWLPAEGPSFLLLGVWHHWDGCWYTTIASAGYGTEQGTGSTTFFPLLPLLGGFLAQVRGNLPLAFAAVNAVALIAAFTGLIRLVTRDFDRETARRTALYVAVFPTAFFLVAPFTEALFLAGSVWAFVGARQRHWEVALVAGLVAGFARPLGLLVMIPVGWEVLVMLVERWRAGGPRVRRSDVLAVLAVLAPALAYAAFVWYSAALVGQSYFAAHRGWGEHELVLPFERLADAVGYAFSHQRPIQLINASAWVVFAALTVAAIRLLPVGYWLYLLPQMVVAFTQHTVWPLMSTSRYMLVLFPCFVVLAIAGRHRRFHVAWLVLSTLLLGYLTSQFVAGAMVG